MALFKVASAWFGQTNAEKIVPVVQNSAGSVYRKRGLDETQTQLRFGRKFGMQQNNERKKKALWPADFEKGISLL